MKKWRWILYAVIGSLLIAGIGRLTCARKGTLSIEVDTVRRRSLRPFITETAVIRPVVEVPISPDVSGEVVQIYVKEGDTVRAGQLLFTIRPDNYRMALLQMQAGLEEAKAQYASAQATLAQQQAAFVQESLAYVRSQRLYEGKALSDAEWDAARLRYQIALAQRQSAENSVRAAYHRIRSMEANLLRAQIDYQRTSVYASMNGVVTRLMVRIGQRVVGVGQMAGTESVRIADLSRFLVEVQVSESDVVRLHPGDSAIIEIQAYPELKLRGYVQQIGYSSGRNVQSEAASALAGEQVSTYLVKVAIDTAGYDPRQYPLRPDMNALVRIYYDRRENALTVPLQAIVLRRGEEVIYVVSNNVALERKVRSGLADDRYVEILEGDIEEGQLIVVGPYEVLQEQLRDSTPVQIRPGL